MWLSFVKYTVKELPPLLRAASRSSTTFFSKGSDVRTPISSLIVRTMSIYASEQGWKYECALFVGFNAILLRGNEVKKSFRTAI